MQVASGGQAFIEHLETSLKSTEGRISTERQVKKSKVTSGCASSISTGASSSLYWARPIWM